MFAVPASFSGGRISAPTLVGVLLLSFPAGLGAGTPVPPPNCQLATVTGANTTAVALPDVTTVTSQITLAGANPFFWSGTATANITHTFSANLDITLISPAGTRVTLSTDNGAGNDNVFAGTTWDDSAATPTTDATYVNLVTQPLLIPEEALDALYGENPNGTWTLEIFNDLAGDTGTLNSWSLEVHALATAPTETTVAVTNNTPVAINDVATNSSTLNLSAAGPFLCRLTLNTSITHTFAADLDMRLLGPTGSTTLSTDNGAGNDNVFNGTLWDDDGGTPVSDFTFANLVTATPVVPEGSFGAFQGINPNGTWTLEVVDDLTGDVGSIDAWTVNATSCGCSSAEADLGITKTSIADIPIGQPVTFTLTVVNFGPADATGVVVTDPLPSGLTYVSDNCGGTFSAPTFTWTLGNLLSGGSAVCELTALIGLGSVTNVATVQGDQVDPDPSNNTATDVVQFSIPPIPTLHPVMMVLLASALGLIAFWQLRRRG